MIDELVLAGEIISNTPALFANNMAMITNGGTANPENYVSGLLGGVACAVAAGVFFCWFW